MISDYKFMKLSSVYLLIYLYYQGSMITLWPQPPPKPSRK